MGQRRSGGKGVRSSTDVRCNEAEDRKKHEE